MELGVTEGYTEDDYNKFKETALVSATSYSTNAKEGCEMSLQCLLKQNLIYIYQI